MRVQRFRFGASVALAAIVALLAVCSGAAFASPTLSTTASCVDFDQTHNSVSVSVTVTGHDTTGPVDLVYLSTNGDRAWDGNAYQYGFGNAWHDPDSVTVYGQGFAPATTSVFVKVGHYADPAVDVLEVPICGRTPIEVSTTATCASVSADGILSPVPITVSGLYAGASAYYLWATSSTDRGWDDNYFGYTALSRSSGAPQTVVVGGSSSLPAIPATATSVAFKLSQYWQGADGNVLKLPICPVLSTPVDCMPSLRGGGVERVPVTVSHLPPNRSLFVRLSDTPDPAWSWDFYGADYTSGSATGAPESFSLNAYRLPGDATAVYAKLSIDAPTPVDPATAMGNVLRIPICAPVPSTLHVTNEECLNLNASGGAAPVEAHVTGLLPNEYGYLAVYQPGDSGASAIGSALQADGSGSADTATSNGFAPINAATTTVKVAFVVYGTYGDAIFAASSDLPVCPRNAAPNRPDAPASDQSSNTGGRQTISWSPATDPDGDAIDHYVLQHKRSDASSFSDVAQIPGTSYRFGVDGAAEGEGTWTYRVTAVDPHAAASDPSPASSTVVVDQTRPNAPTLALDASSSQSPSATVGGMTWFKDAARVTVTANGDPANAADGSAGTGVDAASFPAVFNVTDNGATTASKTVKDQVGNESDAGTLGVWVDAQAPTVALTGCPTAPVPVGTQVSVRWTAADGESGLATAASGAIALTTRTVGTRTATTPATTDRVGHAATAQTCRYTVVYTFDGFYTGVSNTAWNTVPAGSGKAVSLKFSLDGAPVAGQNDAFGLSVLAAGQPVATPVACPTKPTTAAATTVMATASNLSYDGAADRYNYVWKTPTTLKGCYKVTLTFADPVATKSRQLLFLFK